MDLFASPLQLVNSIGEEAMHLFVKRVLLSAYDLYNDKAIYHIQCILFMVVNNIPQYLDNDRGTTMLLLLLLCQERQSLRKIDGRRVPANWPSQSCWHIAIPSERDVGPSPSAVNSCYDKSVFYQIMTTGVYMLSLIARFMGSTWGPSGADRTQVCPMLAPWNLLSGMILPLVFPAMIQCMLYAY